MNCKGCLPPIHFFILCVTHWITLSMKDIFLKVKQYQVLASLLEKRNTVAILLTGDGKSIIFHLFPFVGSTRFYISKHTLLVLTAAAPIQMTEQLICILHLEKPILVVANLNRPKIFIEKQKRKPACVNQESFESILLPIAKTGKLNSVPTYHHLPSSKVVWLCI